MHIPHLHDWPSTAAEAVELQRRLAPRVDVSVPLASFDTVAGCDVAYDTERPFLFAAVVVLRASDLAVAEARTVRRAVTFPYVPGLLSFREVPPLLDAFAELSVSPDVVMLDGQGVAHPRRFGLACHLGLWLGRPCLGCAKSWLVGDYAEPGPHTGDTSPLTIGTEQVGVALRSALPRGRSSLRAVRSAAPAAKPVFVSPGHRIDLASAVAVARATLSGYRHPAPTRAAHLAANVARARGIDD